LAQFIFKPVRFHVLRYESGQENDH
jgi:hypothetical protein